MKINKRVSLRSDCRYSLEGPLDGVIKYLTECREEADAEGLVDLEIVIETFEDYGNAICQVDIMGSRLETDQEEARREFEAQEYAVRNREWKKQQLLALKKELGEL